MEETNEPVGITRRRALKVAGAGAAVAWVAPMVFSAASSASAASGAPSVCTNGFTTCGGPDPGEGCRGDAGCFCMGLAQGGFACIQHQGTCGTNAGCLSDRDCGPGEACYTAGTCCVTSFCRPICAEGRASRAPMAGKDPAVAKTTGAR